ncbi:hypothetical protein [Methanococcus voltae]|uniref:Uncharacterized protein n=1 Tax=Methanococcus voltae (strain ATCC BAA-1334 / A3) TaxID=456320 RepID=D7DRB4_METV3|nr:hypothetical protein [Methanococcus voltae]MCS3901051.1 hypothetical protein [Methanococcus voltae]
MAVVKPGNGDPSVLGLNDFEFNAKGDTIKAGRWTDIYKFTVPVQEQVAIGSDDNGNVGILYGIIKDNSETPAEVSGVIRISRRPARENVSDRQLEVRTEMIKDTMTDRLKAYFLPVKRNKRIGENSKLVIEFMPDTDFVLGDSVLQIPITRW